MPNSQKQIFIIAGCNGSGKTTLAFKLLPDFLAVYDFVNADEIAKGLSPLKPESVALSASKIMIERLKTLMNEGKSFAFETTLAGKNYFKFIKQAQELGYKVNLLFLWLPSVNTALKRVKKRVAQGGHNIPEDTIKRRYKAGISNLINIYIEQVDTAYIAISSAKKSKGLKGLIAKKTAKGKLIVYNEASWSKILWLI
jgi:predicted ABC-type ATPase